MGTMQSSDYGFDDHDRQTALLGAIRQLKKFEPTVSSLETRDPLPTWEEMRRVLGVKADDLAKVERDRLEGQAKSKAKAAALAASEPEEWVEAKRKKTKKKKSKSKQGKQTKAAAKRIEAAAAAAEAATAPRVPAKDKTCRDFFRTGKCSYDPCIFSHDPRCSRGRRSVSWRR